MNFRNFFAFALLSLPLAQIACAANATDSTTDSSEAISSASHSDEGTFCGGFAGITCKAGLSCKLSSNHPDASGVCQKVSGEGGACGDDVAIQKLCADGLTCVLPTGGPLSEHTAGKCEKVVSVAGEWGADSAIMNIVNGRAVIDFGCGEAVIDELIPTGPKNFIGSGSRQAGSGVEFAPGQGPKPEDASFEAAVSGQTMKLKMTIEGQTTDLTFTHGRQITLMHCL